MGSNYCRSLVLVKGNKAVDQTVSLPHKYIFSAKLSVFTAFFLFLSEGPCVFKPHLPSPNAFAQCTESL